VRSRAVTTGKVLEHFAPHLSDFPYNPQDARFIGNPVDYVVFDAVLVSARHEAEEIGRRLDVVDVVEKPIMVEPLMKTVREHCQLDDTPRNTD
jgi:predicted Holliday junction resolvase-like endonuclease